MKPCPDFTRKGRAPSHNDAMERLLELVITPPVGLEAGALDALDDIRRAFARGPAEVTRATQGQWWYRRAGLVAEDEAPAAALRAAGRFGAQLYCADPVRLQVSGDAVVLDAGAAADLSPQDAAGLTDLLNRHFAADGIAFHALAHDQWLMESAAPIEARTCAPERAHARSIEACLPQGAQARRLKQIGNEAQMLLHDCPVNQAREARGQAPINGLWLWGGARRPVVAPGLAGATIFSNRLHVRGLAAPAAGRAWPLPEGAAALPAVDGPALVDLFAAFADPHGWPAWLAGQWLAPLRERGMQVRCVVDLPAACASARLFRGDMWRRLRRGSLVSRLRAAGVDASGETPTVESADVQ